MRENRPPASHASASLVTIGGLSAHFLGIYAGKPQRGLTGPAGGGNVPSVSTSILTSKNRISLPANVVAAAGLRPNDEIAWTVDQAGQIRGRKLSPAPPAAGKLVRDARTGRLYWAGNFTDEELEWAALNANLPRDD